MIKFHCSKCDKKMGVPEDYAGKMVRCPRCKNGAQVPQLAISPESEIEFIEPEPESELEFIETESDQDDTVLYDMFEDEDSDSSESGLGVSGRGKYCSACGKEVAEDAVECGRCGEQFEASKPAYADSMAAERAYHRKKKQAGDDFCYGGFWRRGAAITIDVVVFFIAFQLFVIAYKYGFGYFLKMLNDVGIIDVQSWSQDKRNIITLIIVIAPVVAIFVMYFVRPECGTYQGTIGKRLVGLYVTDMNGNAIGFPRAFVRFIVAVASLIIPISVFLPGFTYRKQGVHDVITGTLVLSNRLGK